MKLIGTVTGVLRDKDTGEITGTFEGTNHIQDVFLEALAGTGSISSGQQMGQDLFISDTNPGAQRRDWPVNIADCRGGSAIGGVDQVTIEYNYAPGIHLGQFVQRFNAPVADYTINIAGLCDYVHGTSNAATDVATVVWLETPCTQTTTETLDLYYRVQLLFEDDWEIFKTNPYNLNPYEVAELARFLFGESASYLLPSSFTPFGLPFTKINGRVLNEPNVQLASTAVQIGGTGLTWNLDDGSDYFCRRQTISRDIQSGVGSLVGHLGSYAGGRAVLMQKSLPSGLSPIQSVFGHRSTSTFPFYASAHAQLGLGTLSIDGAAWTDPDFPKYYRLDVTTTGNVGVGEYKFRMRNHFGFQDNNWYGNMFPLYFTQGNQSHLLNDSFTWARDIDESVFTINGAEEMERPAGSYVYPIDDDRVMVVWKDEFAVVNYHTSEGTAFTHETLVGTDVVPNFLPTDISQVAVDSSGDFYISCRNTGLYKLNAALDTLTVIDSSATGLTNVTGCKAVCIGQAGRVWSYWDHATTPDIYYSDDGGSSWTSAGYSDVFVDANPDLVFNIQADPNDAGGKLALLHYDADGGIGDFSQEIIMKWWDHALTTASDFGKIREIIRTQWFGALPLPYGHNYGLMHLLQCSPNNSYWATIGYYTGNYAQLGECAFFTFGTQTVSALTSTEDIGTYMVVTRFVPDASGNDALMYMSDRGQANGAPTNASLTCLVSQTLAYEVCDSTGSGVNLIDGRWTQCYLRDGVFMCYMGHDVDALAYNNRNVYFLYAAIPEDFTGIPALEEELYPEYGWNGAAWEKGHAGARTLHATAEELMDGVTVTWDDIGGTAPLLDSDHYTFGVYDGIWLDGSTQFDFRWDLYAKPSTWGTDVEAPLLPAATKVSNQFINDVPDSLVAYFQDTQSTTVDQPGELDATGTGLQGDYTAGTRSINPAIRGDAQSYLPNQTYIPGTDTSNCQGYVEFSVYQTPGQHIEYYAGVSPAVVLGTTLDHDTIAHALHFDSVTPGNGVGTCTVRVVENGVERASIDNVLYDTSQTLKGRVALLTNGSVQYEYRPVGEGWVILYTSPAGSVTIENMHFDCHYVPQSSYGLRDMQFSYLDTSNPDYYLYLGDGIDQGVFQPEFQSVDPQSVKVKINGVDAVHIGIDDAVTVLPANTYSIYPTAGVIRYSALDVGKTVSAEYITVHHE